MQIFLELGTLLCFFTFEKTLLKIQYQTHFLQYLSTLNMRFQNNL